MIYEVTVYLKNRKNPMFASFKTLEDAKKFAIYYRRKKGESVRSVSLSRFKEGKLHR